MRAWVDGRLLADGDAPAVAAGDHGLTVGDGVFEAFKVVGGRGFAVGRHLERLGRSAAAVGLAVPDEDTIRAGVRAVLEGQPWERARVRITVTGGAGPFGYGRGEGGPTLIVAADELAPSPETSTVVTVPWPRNERGALSGVKTTSYGESVVALREARRRGADEAVFANTRGELCETTSANVFYVVDGELRTPSLASGCLPGVTRALVLEWYGAAEVDEPIEAVEERASEVFLTSTTRDAQPIRRWNERDLQAPGPVTRQVMETWRERAPAMLEELG